MTDEQKTTTMEILTEGQCWELLQSADVGRLAITAAGEIDIFPVNFVVHERAAVFRTAEGTKLVEVAIGGGKVAFEADGFNPEDGKAWSVVIKGRAEQLDHFDDIYQAQELAIFPWHDGPKEQFVRIVPDEVTGRRFVTSRGKAN